MYNNFGKAVIRKPLFGYNTLFTGKGNTLPLEELVAQKLTDPLFLEGIYWSSPSLYKQVIRFKEQGHELPDEKKQRLYHTLQKYLIRATTRCTPYGIFAGCALTEIGGASTVSPEKPYRTARLDMGLLHRLVQVIATEKTFMPRFLYRLNNSLYSIGKAYRYVEALAKERGIEYQITSIERTEFLDDMLQTMQGKAVRFSDVSDMIGDEEKYEDKLAFFEELIQVQFLVSELFGALTDVAPLQTIEKILVKISSHFPKEVRSYLYTVGTLQRTLHQINATELGDDLPWDLIRDSVQALEMLGIPVDEQHLFQVDLWCGKDGADAFPKHAVKDIQVGMDVLARLTSADSFQEKQLKRFKQLFQEKYGDREVPLVEAVDMEQGIGFPAQVNMGNAAYNEVIDGLVPGNASKSDLNVEKKIMPFEPWLEDKVREAQELGVMEIAISKNEVEAFNSQLGQLAPQISVMGALLPRGKILLHSVGGANGLPFIGRFTYINRKLKDWCTQKILATATEEEELHAEVVHFPAGRTANIARSTGLLPYRIPYLAYENGFAETTLPVTDLMLSVQGDTLVLRSKSRNKRVKPYLAHAHNYMRSDIPLYRFLASVQHQGRQGLQIHWGSWAQRLRFLPRIRTGNIILQRASWNFFTSDIQKIAEAEDAIKELKQSLKRWSVPRFVCIQQGDNELFLDTTKTDYLTLLLQEMKGKSRLKLVEWLYDEVPSDKDVTPVQQFVLPMQKKEGKEKNIAISLQGAEKQTSIIHDFMPGSEWVYFKIYCGAYIADDLLRHIVKPCIEELLRNKTIDKAFFIRYNDPHYHIRFRLHLAQKENRMAFSHVLASLHHFAQPYVEDGRIWKLQLDTYQREVKRYGITTIEASEDAFYADSMAFLHLLEEERFGEDADYRFYMGLQNIDNWLSLFDMSLNRRISFCEEMAGAFGQEFDKSAGRSIDERYRLRRAEVLDIWNMPTEDLSPLHVRSAKLGKRELPEENLPSYIHMSINRWFNTEQRLMEYMLYRYSEKQYKFRKSLA